MSSLNEGHHLPLTADHWIAIPSPPSLSQTHASQQPIRLHQSSHNAPISMYLDHFMWQWESQARDSSVSCLKSDCFGSVKLKACKTPHWWCVWNWNWISDCFSTPWQAHVWSHQATGISHIVILKLPQDDHCVPKQSVLVVSFRQFMLQPNCGRIPCCSQKSDMQGSI